MSNFSNAMGAIGSWVAAHPEILPERLDFTIETLLRWLKKKGKPVTKGNLEEAWETIVSSVEAFKPEKPEVEETELEDVELDKLVAQIDSWSSHEMREHLKNPEVAAATERVLAAKARQKPKQPKPQPKAKAKPPVKKDPLEVSIESMSADAFKKALQDPAKARGIENVLSRRNN